MKNKNQIITFKSATNTDEFAVILDVTSDTIWATEKQISELFSRDRSVIGKHIRNLFKNGELQKDSVCANFAHTASDGKRYNVINYNLDVIISVGYRVKSPVATEFRKWATNKLKEYLIKGYSINEELLIKQNGKIKLLEGQINSLNEKLVKSQESLTDGFLSIITTYSKSFELLNKFDTNDLSTANLNDEIIYVINFKDVNKAINELKKDLIKKGEASELFGNPKDDSFKGILGSISQTVFGELAYPTIEEQAAQLLYSIIKGHSFSDGNKRIGSFVFVWFLEQNNYNFNTNNLRKINENTLVALALAVAQSLPEQRELMVKLIINLVKN